MDVTHCESCMFEDVTQGVRNFEMTGETKDLANVRSAASGVYTYLAQEQR